MHMLFRRTLSFVLVGLAFLYAGERVFSDLTRWTLDGLGLMSLLAGLTLSGLRFRAAQGDRRTALRDLTVHFALCVGAVAIYGLGLPELGLLDAGKAHVALQVFWPTLLFAGLAPAVTIELSLQAAEFSPRIELWRIGLAVRAARIVLLAVVAFAGINYAASVWNRKIDLSYFKTTQVGTANQKLVAGLTQPLKVTLFFPAGNEVLENVRAYVDELVGYSDHASVEVADQALKPELARRLKVRANGYLALEAGVNTDTIRFGLDVEGAASMLRRFDQEMHEKLIKALRPPRVAYVTTGHLERDWSPSADDKRPGLADFRKVLETLGFTVKRLGIGDGLASKVPEDASVVIIPGPVESFLPTEIDTLRRYLASGGRGLFLFDPDHGITGDEILEPLGVKVSRSLVAVSDPRFQWRLDGHRETPYQFATISTKNHPSADTLNRAAGRLAVLLNGAGTVEKTERPPGEMKATFTLRSPSKSWRDEDGDTKRGENEKLTTVDLAAAIERSGAEKEPDGTQKPMRVVVVGDADIIGDMVIRNQGNAAFVMDALRWLVDDEDTAGTVEDEKDVRINHRKEEDRLWFYGSSVAMPALVLVGGLAFTRRSRRPGARGEPESQSQEGGA